MADRALAVLGLFTLEEPVWTVEAVARRLGLSSSTAYGYVRSLVDAGLLVAARSGRYTVGPAVISLDRLTRRHDALGVVASADLLADSPTLLPHLVAEVGRQAAATTNDLAG